MKNLIEILPNIYGVKVPMVKVKYFNIKFDFNGNYVLESVYDTFKLKIPFDFKILGYVTATEISFDASEVVEKNKYGHEGYLDYRVSNEVTKFNWCNPEQSFRSALPKEIYFENPIELPSYKSNEEQLNKDWEEYLKHQDNITEKLLILQKL